MTKYQAVLMRFMKGMLAGVASSISLVTLQQPTMWSEFKVLLSSLGIAVVFGAITGLVLAIEKSFTWKE